MSETELTAAAELIAGNDLCSASVRAVAHGYLAIERQLAQQEESVSLACAEAEVAGYYGQELDSAITCFRDALAQREEELVALRARIAAAPCAEGCATQSGTCNCWKSKP